jgi:hypothetical protein
MQLLVQFLNFVLGSWILPNIPVEIQSFPIAQLESSVGGVKDFLINSLSIIDVFFPSLLLLGIVILVVIAEGSLLVLKALKYGLNLLRGSGS